LPVAFRRRFNRVVLKPISHVQQKGSAMKSPALQVLRACTLTIALLGSVAIITAVSVPDVAFAKPGNGNGGGNGNGNAGGTGSANGNGNGGSAKASDGGDSAKTRAGGADAPKKSKSTASAKTRRLADELGVSASELGALNAAHANANAFKHASPNSRVGKIGLYRDAVLTGRDLEADLEEKTALLKTMTAPDRAPAAIEPDLAAAVDDVAQKSDEVARLEAELAGAGGTDPALEAELAAARAELSDAEAAAQALQDELAEAEAYAALEAEVADLEARVAAQPDLERALLENAANKPVTDAVEAAVKNLLGL
jgi:hypothetical protein